MKRSLLVAALATIGTTAAFAQSSVTVYGRLNVSVEAQKLVGGEKDTAVQNSSSRLGFKGTEDIGGGLKAGFLIEHGFDPSTGETSGGAGNMWGRESHVDLIGSFGHIRLGNMGSTAAYYATADYISMHNHDTGTSSDAFYLYPGNTKNNVSWLSPNFGGATVEVQVGEGQAGSDRTYVVALNYDNGPMHLGLGYVDGPTFGFDDSRELGARILYELGSFTLGAYYMRNEIDGEDRNAYRLAGMYTLGKGEFHLNYGHTDETDGFAEEADQWTVGYNYNLSKRTKLYTFYTKISGDGKDFYAGNVGGVTSSFAVGIRHNF